jgi:hypothetical protein
MIRRDMEHSFGRSRLQNYTQRGASAGPRPWEKLNRLGGITRGVWTPHKPRPVVYGVNTPELAQQKPTALASSGGRRQASSPTSPSASSRADGLPQVAQLKTAATRGESSRTRQQVPALFQLPKSPVFDSYGSPEQPGRMRSGTPVQVPPLDTSAVVHRTPDAGQLLRPRTGSTTSRELASTLLRPSPVRNPDQLGQGLVPIAAARAARSSSAGPAVFGGGASSLDAALERLIKEEEAALGHLRRAIAARTLNSSRGSQLALQT